MGEPEDPLPWGVWFGSPDSAIVRLVYEGGHTFHAEVAFLDQAPEAFTIALFGRLPKRDLASARWRQAEVALPQPLGTRGVRGCDRRLAREMAPRREGLTHLPVHEVRTEEMRGDRGAE